MMAVLDPLARATVLLAVGLLTAALLARRSAAWRHALITASLGAAVLVPLLGPIVPSLSVPLPRRTPEAVVPREAGVTVRLDTRAPALRGTGGAATVPTTAALVWLAGALLGVAAIARAGLRMRRIVAAGQPLTGTRWARLLGQARLLVDHHGPITLAVVDSRDAPATWGARLPWILLPVEARDWDDERARVVLAHELAHVARRDWAIQLAAEVLRALCWWHPLIWIAARQLRRASEIACDERVVAAGVRPCDYADHLVAVARTRLDMPRRWTGVVAMAHQPFLERRIRLMLASHPRRPLTSRHLAVVATAALVLAGAAAALRAQAPTELRGTIFDSTGAVVPEVALTLVRADDTRLEAFTRADGSFSFPAIDAGTYTLEAMLPGFQKSSETFTLETARDWDRAITLQLGTLQETINIVASRTAPADPAAPEAPAPLRVGGNIRVPKKLKDVRAVYPPAMRAEGREGDVQLEAVIDGEGAVKSVRVLGAHVHPDFALAAVDAVRQWRFSPTLLNGSPVDVRMNVKMSFALENGAGQ